MLQSQTYLANGSLNTLGLFIDRGETCEAFDRFF